MIITHEKKLKLIILILSLFIGVCITWIGLFETLREENVITIPDNFIFLGHPTGLEINEKLEYDMNWYVEMYSIKEVISSYLASTIINEARRIEVPVHIAFALAYCESNYNHLAINKGNKDGSFDYGLYQLNINTFPEQVLHFPVDKNTQAGLEYLKSLYDIYGSWDLALVAYNCGKINYFNPTTHAHVKRILTKVMELDKWFFDISEQRAYALMQYSIGSK